MKIRQAPDIWNYWHRDAQRSIRGMFTLCCWKIALNYPIGKYRRTLDLYRNTLQFRSRLIPRTLKIIGLSASLHDRCLSRPYHRDQTSQWIIITMMTTDQWPLSRELLFGRPFDSTRNYALLRCTDERQNRRSSPEIRSAEFPDTFGASPGENAGIPDASMSRVPFLLTR